MIDYAARKELAELLRHFIAGRVTNLEFDGREEEWSNSEDAALWLVFHKAWHLYDDFSEHRMTGDWRINKEGRREIARWILFLQTDLEYQWCYSTPQQAWWHLISVITFNLFPAFREPSYKDLGDSDVWPFYRRDDFDRAVRSPKLLAGV